MKRPSWSCTVSAIGSWSTICSSKPAGGRRDGLPVGSTGTAGDGPEFSMRPDTKLGFLPRPAAWWLVVARAGLRMRTADGAARLAILAPRRLARRNAQAVNLMKNHLKFVSTWTPPLPVSALTGRSPRGPLARRLPAAPSKVRPAPLRARRAAANDAQRRPGGSHLPLCGFRERMKAGLGTIRQTGLQEGCRCSRKKKTTCSPAWGPAPRWAS